MLHAVRITARSLIAAAVVAAGCAFLATSAHAGTIRSVMKGIDAGDPDDAVNYAVQATLDGTTLTITNPASNANAGDGDSGVITSVDLNGAGGYSGNGGNGGNGLVPLGSFSPYGQDTASGGSSPQFDQCVVLDSLNLNCEFADYETGNASGGIQPGQSATITYATNAPNVLDSVSENFDFEDLFPNCRPNGYGDDLRQSSSPFGPLATAAGANNCAPPSKIRINSIHVNAQKHTVSFQQSGKDATKGFTCELLRNGKQLYNHACGANKAYTNALPVGSYVYYVWGLNSAGVSRDFGVAHFKLK
jgi:hypothetical protein